jgi:DNA-binding SARP family transcriptional activator
LAHLVLSVLGGHQVELDGHPVTEFKSSKVRALLAYLAVEAGRPHRREALAGLLWPEQSDRAALGNLRYSLASLRRTLGERSSATPFLLITHDTIQFNPASDTWLDVAQLERQIIGARTRLPADAAVAELESALALYRGGFLAGFSVSGAAPFEEWALLQREQIARRVMGALNWLVMHLDARGEYAKAQTFARQQVTLEPWNEEAHRALMRALARGGQRNAALHQFQDCCRILKDELDIEPSDETVALYEAILTGKLVATAPKGQGDRRAAGQGAIPVLDTALLVSEPPLAPAPSVVARDGELARLDSALTAARGGAGRVVFIAGEVGSGKTALLDEFTRRALQAHPDLLVATGSCDAAAGIGDPYLPFREILQLLTGDIEPKRAGATLVPKHARRLWAATPDAVKALVEQGPDLIDSFVPGAGLALRAEAFIGASWPEAAHLRLEQLLRTHTAAGPSVRSMQQSDIFDQVTHVLQTLARRHPLCLLLDDLQWADSGSVSLLFHLGRRIATSRILLVAAYRPDDVVALPGADRRPLELVINELQRISGAEPIDLDACDGKDFIAALLRTEPYHLGPDFEELLFRRTEGHPLFTVELLRSLEERGDLARDGEGRWTEGPALHWDRLPARVEAAIAERIGRLSDRCQSLLAAASVEGQEFTAEVIARATAASEQAVFQCLSGDLAHRHRLVTAASVQRAGQQRLSRYRFRHHLFQQYLYDHLDEVRRAHLHEAIGSALEELHADTADQLAVLAPRLAWHFAAAGLADRAAAHHLQAGYQAARLSAYEEAIAHLTRGLTLLDALPATSDRVRLKLDLQLATALPYSLLLGFWAPQRIDALERAYELAQHPALSASLQRRRALAAVAFFANWSAQPERTLAIGEQLLHLAEQAQDQEHVLLAHSLLGSAHAMRANLVKASKHLDSALVGYEHRGHEQPNLLLGLHVDVMSLSLKAAALWLLGYPDQASRLMEEAMAAAQASNDSGTLGFAQIVTSLLFSMLGRDPEVARQQAIALNSLQEKGLPLAAWAGSLANWAPGGDLQDETALQQMRRRHETFRAFSTGLGYCAQVMHLAQVYAQAGQVQTGLASLDEALAWTERTGVFVLAPEVHRLRGELVLMDHASGKDAAGKAEAYFRTAIDMARRQGSRWWELRATASLCRLLKNRSAPHNPTRAAARQMLAELSGWFSEGFATQDLREARMLLTELDKA